MLIDVATRSVREKRATATEIDRSRTIVPWISPALEHPITTERGYARVSSASASGVSIVSGAPNARTRVRGESRRGSFADHRLVARSYETDSTWKAFGSEGRERVFWLGVRSPSSSGERRAGAVAPAGPWMGAGIGGGRSVSRSSSTRARGRTRGVSDSLKTVRVIVWLWRSHEPEAYGLSSPYE